MSELELLISKYLDDEVSAAELAELQRCIASDPEARALYAEMTAIRRAARRAPTLRAPLAVSEARLFERLRHEGFGTMPLSASPIGSTRPGFRPSRRRAGLVGAMLGTVAIAAMLFIAPIAQLTQRDSGTLPLATTMQNNDAAEDRTSDAPSASTPSPATSTASSEASTADAASRRSEVVTGIIAPVKHIDAIAATPDEKQLDDAPRDSTAQSESTATNDDPTIPAGEELALASPAVLPVPDATDAGEPLLSATLRYGSSLISRTSDVFSEDVSVGLDFNLGDGHRLAVLGGRSAAVTEQRATNTHAIVARAAVDKNGARLARAEVVPQPYDIEVGKEWWVGLGYNYSLNQGQPLELTVGARGAVGPRSLHVGAEAPVRYHVTRQLAVEMIPSAAFVVPHDRARSEYSIDNASDGYLYEAESEHTSFSTFGVAIGVRFVLD